MKYTGSEQHLAQARSHMIALNAAMLHCQYCNNEYSKPNLNQHEVACKQNPGNLHECTACGILTYKPKFCSKSCSASFNNKNRDYYPRPKTSKIQRAKTIQRILATGFKSNNDAQRNIFDVASGPYSRIYLKTCSITEQIFFSQNSHAQIRPSVLAEFTYYRRACKFNKLNVFLYPNEFDLSLIEKHGFYHNTKNKKGISRDHMYSITEGFKNNVSFKIIKHPANAVLMLHIDNVKKRHRCTITLNELYKRIAIWDKKYNL